MKQPKKGRLWLNDGSCVRLRPVADQEHFAIFDQGIDDWNEWRRQNPDVRPDFDGAVYFSAGVSGADLSGANLSLTGLQKADLNGVNLTTLGYASKDRFAAGAVLAWDETEPGPKITTTAKGITRSYGGHAAIGRAWVDSFPTTR